MAYQRLTKLLNNVSVLKNDCDDNMTQMNTLAFCCSTELTAVFCCDCGGQNKRETGYKLQKWCKCLICHHFINNN